MKQKYFELRGKKEKGKRNDQNRTLNVSNGLLDKISSQMGAYKNKSIKNISYLKENKVTIFKIK